jgi:hypothetical protein
MVLEDEAARAALSAETPATPVVRKGVSGSSRKRTGGAGPSREIEMIGFEEAVDAAKLTRAQRRVGEVMKRTKRRKKATGGETGEDAMDSGDEAYDGLVATYMDFRSRKQPSISLEKGFFKEQPSGDPNQKVKEYIIHVDCRMIEEIPMTEDRYNHRLMEPDHVRNLMQIMERAARDPLSTFHKEVLYLAPIRWPVRPGQKAERITPSQYKEEEEPTYHWYAVAGQHNAAAARTLLGSNSPAARKYNFNAWPARVVYYPDDHFACYELLSVSHNLKDAKKEYTMQLYALQDIHRAWLLAGKPVTQKGMAGSTDPVRVAMEGKWRDFQRTALSMVPNADFWEESKHAWSSKWSDKLRPWIILPTARNSEVWRLAQTFYNMWNNGLIPGVDGAPPATKKGVKIGGVEVGKGMSGGKVVHRVQGRLGPGYFVEFQDPVISNWGLPGGSHLQGKD